MPPIAQWCVILACENAVLPQNRPFCPWLAGESQDLCVLGWIAKNMVHAWRHKCGGVCVFVHVCVC